MEIQELMKHLTDLSNEINSIVKKTEFELYEDLSGVSYDKNSSEDLLLLDEAKRMMDKLASVSATVDYLNRPIKRMGVLHKNDAGRYEIDGSATYYTSGSLIEFLCTDDRYIGDEGDTIPYWQISHIEANEKGQYYIVYYNHVQLDGLVVRTR